MSETYRSYGNDAEMAGAAPIPGDPHEMGRIISQELARRREQELLGFMEEAFVEAEDVLPVGDLLDKVQAAYGSEEKTAAAFYLLWTMQERGEAMLYADNDRQRIVVERLRSSDQA